MSPSFRLLHAIIKSSVSTTFRGVYANGQPCLCRRNLMSVTCHNVPGPPPSVPIVWEVGPGNEATWNYGLADDDWCGENVGLELTINLLQGRDEK